MRQIVLGKSGLVVSAVGFGGIPIMRVSEAQAERAIHAALDLGVNFIDTAAGYGDSQKKIGLAIRGRRDGLVLATKSGEKTKDAVAADIERSRREMGVDVVDLFQFHGISGRAAWTEMSAPGGGLEAVLEARDKGHVAHIGFSSHSLDGAMDLLDDSVFETIQFPFNLVTREPDEALIPKARRNRLGFIVMKPLCGGMYDDAELAFGFLNHYPDLVPIPGIERPEEIEQIVPLVNSRKLLSGDDKDRAEQIAADLGKVFCRRCGYCLPCPNDIPVPMAMNFEGFLKRFPPENVSGLARQIVDTVDNCDQCRQCEDQCPYDLPIVETLQRVQAAATEFLKKLDS